MNALLLPATIVVSIALVILTLFQGKGGGIGGAIGGAGAGFQTRRGLEKVMLRATIVLVIIFFLLTLIHLLS